MSKPSLLNDHGALLFAGALLLVLGLVLQPAGAVQGSGPGNPTGVTQNPGPVRQMVPAIATSDSNGSMIAVTGIDLTGSSILYLVDTNSKQLAIYQASGGSDSMQGVKLVGARKIDLDLQLEGYNDKSQYSYEELEKRFQDNLHAQPSKGSPSAKKP